MIHIQQFDPGCLWPLEVYHGITYAITTKGRYNVIRNTYDGRVGIAFSNLDYLKRWAIEEYFVDHL